ncbi:MAG: hypothetical protein ACQEVT_07410 [Pseudomonadota bacterium]|uniref:hypothetical protein n=1 Tax=Roseovarius TaxID=74030 RepID=UPI0022A84A37|nr:hypothetical protein [Roseovarius sp. EGI FJ00037]MCZ0812009.1 hypothetical protein [Roseovarius sp. EGI FJ00037]
MKGSSQKAAWVREQSGIDSAPIRQRRLEIEQGNLKEGRLGPLALKAYETHKQNLKRKGSDGRWFSPLRLHVLPKLGKMPIVKIDQEDTERPHSSLEHRTPKEAYWRGRNKTVAASNRDRSNQGLSRSDPKLR